MNKSRIFSSTVSGILISTFPMTDAVLAAPTALGHQPLVARSNIAPNVLFALSVEYPTANTAAYQDSSGYSVNTEYLGYFDPKKCYLYDGQNNWFYPTRLTINHTCASNSWSGNFMNWGTMTGLDAFRMAMTGGNRYIDYGSTGTPAYLTVLERANHSGQGVFTDKSLTSSNSNRALNLATPLLGSTGNATVEFFNTGLDERMKFSKVTVNAPNAVSSAQAPGSAVTNVKITFRNATNSSQSNVSYIVNVPSGLDSRTILVTGSAATYNSATGDITFSGLDTSLSAGQTQSVVVSYPTPSSSTLSTLTAVMRRNGSTNWGEITITKELNVRVRVCDNSVGLEANCQLYGTASYKPVGVIQQNGSDMRFGVFSYFNSNETNNAVMRAPLKTTAPKILEAGSTSANPNKEWSELDGTFRQNPDIGLSSYTTFTDSGVINYINKFGRSGSYKTYDPVGRLYYEALAYLRNRPADTAFYTGATTANAENFPIIPGSAWNDPIQASCQANYIVLMGDNHSHCDKKLPGGRFGSSVSQCTNDKGSLANGDPVDAWQWTKNLGTMEGLNSWESTTFTGTNNSSTYMSGLAYFARSTDIRPDDLGKPNTIGKQTVKTFIINVEENGDKGVGSQFWYASKYGGFDDISGNTAPTTFNSWSVADNSYPGGRRPKTLFPASNPKAMIDGVQGALRSIAAESGSASAAATSSPNVTQSNNYIYSSTYRTVFWDGEVTAQKIDSATGNIMPNVLWQGSSAVNSQADALASGTTGARKLYTLNTASTATDKKKTFDYTSLTATERSWFQGKCTVATADAFQQCTDGTLSASQKTVADDANNLINYLRGFNTPDAFGSAPAYGYLDIFRNNRINRLGDIVNAAPVYVGPPRYNFAMNTGGESYATFKTRVAARTNALYIAANDGFLHGFKDVDGKELFAYTPRQLLPDLYKLADKAFSNNHRYYVDGTPVTMDIYDSNDQKWKTVLVGGLNNGGAGYYALDVTDPTAPQALWEICRDASRCPNGTISTMGQSYGNPVITRLPPGNPNAGKWVVLVSSGYNNSTGKGYVYVINVVSGELLDTYTTDSGSNTEPSGLSKLSTYSPNFGNDGVSSLAYGGDLNGNVWRFDLTKGGSQANSVSHIIQLKDANNLPQPVTTKLEVGAVPGHPTWPLLFVGTGRYLSTEDFTYTKPQSIYAFKDPFGMAGARSYESSRGGGWLEQRIIDKTQSGRIVRSISNPQSVNWVSQNGWFVDFPDNGERVALDLQLNLGTLLVATNVVNSEVASACQVGGYSWLYQLNYGSGSFISSSPDGQAATKFDNALLVGNTVARIPSGVLKVISTTAKGDKVTDAFNGGGAGGIGRKISWREIFK